MYLRLRTVPGDAANNYNDDIQIRQREAPCDDWRNSMSLIESISRILAWSIGAACIGLTLAPPAAAQAQKTKWFSIDIQPATDSTPTLYLTSTSEGLKLDRYRSGDPTQQWTATQIDYPWAPRVEGHGPLEGITNCTWHGCPFKGHSGGLYKYVNRASGACLAFALVGSVGRAVLQRCSGADNDIPAQTWMWMWGDGNLINGAPPRGEFSPLVSRFRNQNQCLSSSARQRPGKPSALQPDICDDRGGPPWFQRFRFLETAELTCTVHWFWDLCFVQGQR